MVRDKVVFRIENGEWNKYEVKSGTIMKTLKNNPILLIGGVCSTFILLITILVVLVNCRWGIIGILILFFLAIASLQLYKLIYEMCAVRKAYNQRLITCITNCWIVYLILDISLCTGGLFSALMLMAETGVWGIPKSIYCLVIVVLAILLTLKPIQPFINKESYREDKKYPAQLINAFVPRFVILYTFVVFYFLSFANYSSSNEIIPSLCVVYIGIERLINMFSTVKLYAAEEYEYLLEDTERWIRKSRKMDSSS